ncbi:hypothetical protein HMPREF9120_02570, partial [Neisseria sp. oral taxon 020 str. F0370]
IFFILAHYICNRTHKPKSLQNPLRPSENQVPPSFPRRRESFRRAETVGQTKCAKTSVQEGMAAVGRILKTCKDSKPRFQTACPV